MSWRVGRRVSALGLATVLLALFAAAPAWAATAYVSAFNDNKVVRLDTVTGVAGPAMTIKAPAGISMTPDGRTGYVTGEFGDGLTPFDPGTSIKATAIAALSPFAPISPDGKLAFVRGTPASESIVPITLPVGAIGSPIKVGKEVRDVVFAPDGKTAYAVCGNTKTLVPVNVATGVAGTPIPVGEHPVAAAISPDGATAYVADEMSVGHLISVDLASGKLGNPTNAGVYPSAVAVAPDGKYAYVAGNTGVTPIELRTEVPEPLIALPAAASIAITPDGTRAYVGAGGSKVVTPIDLATKKAGTGIEVGEGGYGVAMVPSQAPQPAIAVSGARTSGGQLAFDGSASVAPLGKIASYSWDFGDGTTATGPTATHAYAKPGTYTATLTVDNGEGCRATYYNGHSMVCNGASKVSATTTIAIPEPAPAPNGGSGQRTATPTPPGPPQVRVACPKRAGAKGCRIAVRGVVAKAGPRVKPEATTATARTKLAAGTSAILLLRPKAAFASKLIGTQKVLVAVQTKIGGVTTIAYKRLPNFG